jgi:hypothetical protein
MFSEAGEALLKAAQPDYERIKALLDVGANFNEVDPEDGETVFSRFVEDHHHPITDFLSMGAKLSVPGHRGFHPLIYAVLGVNYGLLRTLLEHGADPNQIVNDEVRPFTALDAVADQFHSCTYGGDSDAHMVLNAMRNLLKSYGGKSVSELEPRANSHEDPQGARINPSEKFSKSVAI